MRGWVLHLALLANACLASQQQHCPKNELMAMALQSSA